MNNPRITNLIRQIDEIMHQLPWLDESFDKKLADLPEEIIFTQPRQGIHSISENLSHLVQWRRELINRFQTGQRSTDSEKWNWIPNEKLKEQSAASLLNAFEETFDELQELMMSKDDSYLDTPYYDKDYGYLLEGWLHHDIYHLGQIGLVLRLLRK